MHDLPPDLPRLRTLETWLAHSLQRVRAAIAAVEQREAERGRGGQARPEPDWMIEPGINPASPAVYVHVGGCHMAGKRRRAASREQARQALLDGVAACAHCRPDTELGIIDG